MLSTESYYKLTRRGRIIKTVKERYLRDDIACGIPDCALCSRNVEEPMANKSVTASEIVGTTTNNDQVHLSTEPQDNTILIIDTNVVLHQIDVLEAANSGMTDVVILQTVLDETKGRNYQIYRRLHALINNSARRFVPFANMNHSEIFGERLETETVNDYHDRMIRRASKYLRDHYAESAGLDLLLITNDAENAKLALQENIPAMSMKQWLVQKRGDHKHLLDLLALPDTTTPRRPNTTDAGASSSDLQSTPPAGSAPGSGSPHPSAASARPSVRRKPGALYREHLSLQRMQEGVQTRQLFKGTLRMPRDSNYYGRVSVHGIEGKGHDSAKGGVERATGGGDSIRVLISGWQDLNRACDGDEVVIELLPRNKWKNHPSALTTPDVEPEPEVAPTDAEGPDAEAKGSVQDLRQALAETQEQLFLAAQAVLQRNATSAMPRGSAPEPTGRVVGIIKRNWRPMCGSLDPNDGFSLTPLGVAGSLGSDASTNDNKEGAEETANAGASRDSADLVRTKTGSVVTDIDGSSAPVPALFIPVDPRFPRVRIDTRQKRALLDKRLVVVIDNWDIYSRYPRGHYVRTLGVIGERLTENQVIMLEHDIVNAPFSRDVMACLPPANWQVTAENSAGRVDLRDIVICSIDPPGCKDIDDALHARVISSNNGKKRKLMKAPIAQEVKDHTTVGLDGILGGYALDSSENDNKDEGDAMKKEDAKSLLDIEDEKNTESATSSDKKVDEQDDSEEEFDITVEVGVHIADVTYFVKQGTPIDREAANRGNTTYLVEQRLDMLPGLLTESLCSLRPFVSRFAFSATWEFKRLAKDDPRGAQGAYAKLAPEDRWEVVPSKTRFFKSIIQSRSAYTYEQAQKLVDDPNAKDPLAKSVKLLASVARCLRRQRIEAGALSLSSPEVKFLLDSETHEPLDVMAYQTFETNSTIEEFMLLANCSVAERIQRSFPRSSLLRRHPAPPPSSFLPLLQAANAVGVNLAVDNGKAVGESLDSAHVPGRPYFNKLLRILATRCMQQAVYFPSGECNTDEYFHYGLAAPIYTHFTSPIRRYCDVVVHRLLAAALELEPLPRVYEDREFLKGIADNINKRHLMAQLAGRASGSLHTNRFFQGKAFIEKAMVMTVKNNGVVILVPRMGLEHSILLSTHEQQLQRKKEGRPMPDTPRNRHLNRVLQYDEKAQSLHCVTNPDLKIGIFDEVKVLLFVEDKKYGRKELALRLVDPPFDPLPTIAELPKNLAIEDYATQAYAAKKKDDVAPPVEATKEAMPEEKKEAMESPQNVGQKRAATPSSNRKTKKSK